MLNDPIRSDRTKYMVGPNISSDTLKKLTNQKATTQMSAVPINIVTKKIGSGSVSSGMGSGIGGGLASMSANFVASGINNFSKVDTTPQQQMAKDAITNAIGMIPGWGTAVSAALKVSDAIGNATGLNLDTMSKEQSQAAGINGWERIANNVIGTLPANFLLGTAFVGNTRDAYNTREVQELSDAFGGTVSDINVAGTMGGKSYLFGKNKADSFITQSNRNVDLLTNLNKTNSIRKKATGEDFASQNYNIYNGRSMASDRVYIGKTGLKLASKSDIQIILQNRKLHNDFIESFQNGGTIGVDTNVLPEGALHKDKNHLEEANPEVGEEVTNKGIPVIVTDENGEIEQVAEIEREEIILRKEVTDRLEQLWKEGTEEAMIWAGKLLAEEIITNTQDNTGQLE